MAELPDPSTNLYVTLVCPTGKKAPGVRVLEATLTTPELSVAVGSTHWTTVPPRLMPIVVEISSTQVTTGATLSAEMDARLGMISSVVVARILSMFFTTLRLRV